MHFDQKSDRKFEHYSCVTRTINNGSWQSLLSIPLVRQFEFRVGVIQCHTMLYCNTCLVPLPVVVTTWFCAADWIKLIYYAAKVLDSVQPNRRWMQLTFV